MKMIFKEQKGMKNTHKNKHEKYQNILYEQLRKIKQ